MNLWRESLKHSRRFTVCFANQTRPIWTLSSSHISRPICKPKRRNLKRSEATMFERAVTRTIRMLKSPTEERQRPIFVARNLYFLLDELDFPNIERLNEALRSRSGRPCGARAPAATISTMVSSLQDPNSSAVGMDAPLNPPLPKFEEGDYRLESVRSPSEGFSVWLSFPGRLAPLYPVEGYPKISEFRTILERLDVRRVLISWNGRYFLAYTVADEKDEIGVEFSR